MPSSTGRPFFRGALETARQEPKDGSREEAENQKLPAVNRELKATPPSGNSFAPLDMPVPCSSSWSTWEAAREYARGKEPPCAHPPHSYFFSSVGVSAGAALALWISARSAFKSAALYG